MTTSRYTLLPSHPSLSDSDDSSDVARMHRSYHDDDDDESTLRPRLDNVISDRYSDGVGYDGDSESVETDSEPEDDELENAHSGVKKVEAAKKVYSHGRYSKIILFISLGLASYIYALDSSTTSVYLTYATSTFGEHSKISSIQVVQSIIIAVGKPIIAKVADVTSRATAYLVVLIFYIVGYTAIATAQSVGAIGSGIVIYAVGYTGLHLLTQILIADITTLSYRGLVSSLTTLPFIVNGFIGPMVSVWVLEHLNQNGDAWRWGYAMFAILLPICLSPLIITLFWAERMAAKMENKKRLNSALVVDSHSRYSRDLRRQSLSVSPLIRSRSRSRSSSPSISRSPNNRQLTAHAQLRSITSITPHPSRRTSLIKRRAKKFWRNCINIIRTFLIKTKHLSAQLDLFGLMLLGAGVGMILLPLTLSRKLEAGVRWGTVSTIGPLFTGFVILALFAIYDLRYAKKPVMALRFVRNRSVVCACIVGFFDFASFFLTFTYLYTFVLVVKPWSSLTATYFMQVQTVALTIFGFTAGVSMWWFRRYKYVLIGGLCVRLLGVALMIHSRGANASTFELVSTQILQGMGGGFAAASSQVGAQASVPHADVAIVTALVLLLTEIGGAVGGGLAGGIWTKAMPQKLAEYLPHLSDSERAKLFGDIVSVIDLPRDDLTRLGVMRAYDDTMKTMVIIATIMSVIPILSSLFMPNWYLGDTQNAVESEDDEDMLIGGSVSVTGRSESESSFDDDDSENLDHRDIEALEG